MRKLLNTKFLDHGDRCKRPVSRKGLSDVSIPSDLCGYPTFASLMTLSVTFWHLL